MAIRCPTCGAMATMISVYQETSTYHCSQCGTLATKVYGQPTRVRCVPVRAAAHDDLLAALNNLADDADQLLHAGWNRDDAALLRERITEARAIIQKETTT